MSNYRFLSATPAKYFYHGIDIWFFGKAHKRTIHVNNYHNNYRHYVDIPDHLISIIVDTRLVMGCSLIAILNQNIEQKLLENKMFSKFDGVLNSKIFELSNTYLRPDSDFHCFKSFVQIKQKSDLKSSCEYFISQFWQSTFPYANLNKLKTGSIIGDSSLKANYLCSNKKVKNKEALVKELGFNDVNL